MSSGYLLRVMHDEKPTPSTGCLLNLAWLVPNAASPGLITLTASHTFLPRGEGQGHWPVGFLLIRVGNRSTSQLDFYFALF